MASAIPKHKRDLIRKDYFGEKLPLNELSQRLGISRSTLVKHRMCLKALQRHYPDRIEDLNFTLSQSSVLRHEPEVDQYTRLGQVLPGLIDSHPSKAGLKLRIIHAAYKQLVPRGYKFQDFYVNLNKWRREHNICYYHHLRIRYISPEDLLRLRAWRKSAAETRKWKRAVVILGAYEGRHLKDLMAQVEINLQTLLKWLDDYKAGGMAALERKEYAVCESVLGKRKTKQDNLVKIVHQAPRLHGINRTSWRFTDLAEVYQRLHNEPISASTVHDNLLKSDYRFKKSRETLTSPDPRFREKLDFIQDTLRNLKPNESFFSIDEYGHFSVKLRGGRAITKKDEFVSVPQLQRSKGFLIVIAALELATNQVTHFYARKKDTAEMIRLVDLLMEQYKGQQTLYLSWDAASWHSSVVLKARLEELNSDAYRAIHNNPTIKLVPLPSSAQFLNVIESVFSGLAKAVIHNSNYPSLEACQAAIDLHFRERNQHFLSNPRQAGHRIWGKELVKPVFNEANHCQGRK